MEWPFVAPGRQVARGQTVVVAWSGRPKLGFGSDSRFAVATVARRARHGRGKHPSRGVLGGMIGSTPGGTRFVIKFDYFCYLLFCIVFRCIPMYSAVFGVRFVST